MPKPSTSASKAFATSVRPDLPLLPAENSTVASAKPPLVAQGMGRLYALVHRAWHELPVKATALGSFIAEKFQAILLNQAVDYCAHLTDMAAHGAVRVVDPHDQMPPLVKSLLLAVVAALPSSQELCSALLHRLQTEASALVNKLLAAWSGDANPVCPADSQAPENALNAWETSTPSDFIEPTGAMALTDLDGQSPDPAFELSDMECVCLVGNWDTSDWTPLP